MKKILKVKQMILNKQSFYKGKKLPSPQTHGTFFQKDVYAFKAAQKFLKENETI